MNSVIKSFEHQLGKTKHELTQSMLEKVISLNEKIDNELSVVKSEQKNLEQKLQLADPM